MVSDVDPFVPSITYKLKDFGDKAFEATAFEAYTLEILPYRLKEREKWIEDHKHLFNAAVNDLLVLRRSNF